jgi:hypothetical protein
MRNPKEKRSSSLGLGKSGESWLNTTAEKATVIRVPTLRALHYPQRLIMELSRGGWDSKFASGPGYPWRR